MESFLQFLQDLKEKYDTASLQIETATKSDKVLTEDDSMKLENNLLAPMERKLEQLTEEYPDERDRLKAILSQVHMLYSNLSTDDAESALSHAYISLNILKKIDDYHYVYFLMETYNRLGILWFDTDLQKALKYLNRCVDVYDKSKTNPEPPFNVDNLFNFNLSAALLIDKRWKLFDKAHTITLYYLAQVHRRLDDPDKSSFYCHLTLRRQLICDDYEPIDWFVNAATLSQFFLERKCFKEARHHLSAASCIMERFRAEQLPEHPEKTEEFQHREADLARCWCQYGLNLLIASKDRLMNDDEETNDREEQDLSFPTLDLKEWETEITDCYILTLGDAKPVFLNAQTWLKKAQIYYSLNSLASDYIDITMDHSKLYQSLSFFEEKPEERGKYLKRAIDLIEALLDKVNPKFYLSHFRRMWYELGIVYMELLDIKMDKQRETKERPKPQALCKINTLTCKALEHFNSFLYSFTDKKVTEEEEASYAQVQFYVAALHGKFITLDKKKQLENIKNSLNGYAKVVEFCDEREDLKSLMKMQYQVSAEMIKLLPFKIHKLEGEVETIAE